MERIEATFRVVTPMFLSGAAQDKAELRLPSIKGALRFWWRALAWGQYGNDLERLHKAEARLFGGVGNGEGQAKVVVRLLEQNISTDEQKKWRINDWQAYIGYGLIKTTGGTTRQFIKPGSTFTLSLATKNSLSGNEADDIRRSLLALGLLGGLGGRSRKGWGSLTLINLHGFDWRSPEDVSELEQHHQSLMTAQKNQTPSYTAFSTQAQIVMANPVPNAVTAHRLLADIYKNAVKPIEGKYDKREREEFGLPRRVRGRNDNERRASPLCLHVHELPDGRCVPVATFLPATFLELQPMPLGGYKRIAALLKAVSGRQG